MVLILSQWFSGFLIVIHGTLNILCEIIKKNGTTEVIRESVIKVERVPWNEIPHKINSKMPYEIPRFQHKRIQII